MHTYSLLREVADSWVLLALFAVFAAVILWAWRPGSRRLHDEAANVPFRHEAANVPFRHEAASGCAAGCAGCTCVPRRLEEPRHG